MPTRSTRSLSSVAQLWVTHIQLRDGTFSFDAEVAQFLRAIFEKTDIRYGIPSYSTVWAVMKVCIPLSVDLHWRLHNSIVRKWSLYRLIPRVQGVCSGHTWPAQKEAISLR